MKFETQKDRPLIEAGEHVLKLTAVDTLEMDDLYGQSKDGSGKVTKIIWRFVSQSEDEDGNPFEYAIFTGMTYGNEAAAMTKLVDMLVPGMTPDKFADFDSDDLIGKKFRGQIKHVKKENGSGMKAVHVYITPIAAKPAKPAPIQEDDDLSDPFADS